MPRCFPYCILQCMKIKTLLYLFEMIQLFNPKTISLIIQVMSGNNSLNIIKTFFGYFGKAMYHHTMLIPLLLHI